MLRRRIVVESRPCFHPWRWEILGGVLSLVVLFSGSVVASPDTVRNDELKKATEKEEPKKTDAEKEIDDLIDEMTRNMPKMDESMAKRMRDEMRRHVQNMSAEQRKNMLSMMRNRGGIGVPGPGIGVPTMPPGFGGSYPDARLGARLEAPSATLTEQLDLPKDQGLVVREVRSESAAEKAGIKPNDILLEVNGKSVSNRPAAFRRLLSDIKPDASVEIVVLRKGKKETIKDVKLPEAKETVGGFQPGGAFPPGGGFPGGFPPAPPRPPLGPAFPPGPGFVPPQPGDARTVMTTMVRTPERFTLRHQEGSLIITLTGAATDGKAKVKTIHVQDGARNEKYESVDKVPEQYQDKVKNLIQMSEKSAALIEIK